MDINASCTILGMNYANESSADTVIVATACMFVEPDGRVITVGTCDQVYDTSQTPHASGPICVTCPAQSCNSTELQQQACAVVEQAYKEIGLFGFVTAEFALVEDSTRRPLQVLQIIADYTPPCSKLQTFMLATGTLYSEGRFNSVPAKPERRDLSYTDQIPWVDKSRISRAKPSSSRYERVGIQFPNLRHIMLNGMSWASFVSITDTSYDHKLAFANLDLIEQKLRSDDGRTDETSSLQVAAKALATVFSASSEILKDLQLARAKRYLLHVPDSKQQQPEEADTTGQAATYANVELLFSSIPSAHLHLGNPSWNNVSEYTPILPTLKLTNPRIQRGLPVAEYLRIMEQIADEIDEAERDKRVWQNVHVLRSGIVRQPRPANEQNSSSARAALSQSPPPAAAAMRASDFMGPVPSARRKASAASIVPKADAKPAKKFNKRPPSARGKLLQEHLPAGPKSVVRQVVTHLFDEA
ncbi:hypothetical protein HDU86_002087 [Geranomyces michiganensis]|nr:hypothetical protein HDU86_002087 [Geranomyces michiganensis]